VSRAFAKLKADVGVEARDRRHLKLKDRAVFAKLAAHSGGRSTWPRPHTRRKPVTQHGLALARRICSECHAIQVQQLRSLNPRSPTFPDIAKTPGTTETGFTVALTTPHAGMPMFRLTAEQRTDINCCRTPFDPGLI
jgi:hypothetical protein